MTIAVVLSTYNGEKYIKKQLDSLLFQDTKPDKVYICDDCSSDNTVKIVKDFIEDNSLIDWELSVNKHNVGWKQNFHKLISNAKEDIIFLCDQDDIWNSNKISSLYKQFELFPNAELIACGYEPFYDDNTSKVSKLITNNINDTGKISLINMSYGFMDVLRPGCTYAVKKSFCNRIDMFWNDDIPHDALLWRFSIVSQTGYLYDRKLIKWRRYNNSSSNPHYNSISDPEIIIRYNNTIKSIESHLLFYKSLIKFSRKNHIDKSFVKIINEDYSFEKKYYRAITNKAFLKVLVLGIKNRKFFLSYKTIIADFLMVFGIYFYKLIRR